MTEYRYTFSQHPQTGWQIVRLHGGGTSIAYFSPEIGSNLMSLAFDGVEYLYPLTQDQDKYQILGTPILYPTPNRVRNATFTFAGRTYTFTPNNGPHFIHGLVREVPWEVTEPQAFDDEISVTTSITFAPGTSIYALFPIHNTLSLTYTLRPNSLRFDFVVRNEDQTQLLPFGLAIHPYFRIIGPRERVRLEVPAQKWMEAIDLLPTGRLVDLEDSPADLRTPTPLSRLDLDDVYWGLTPDRPQVIYYDHIGTRITLQASELFTHSVVYTPADRPYFCIENQSCSTDAHNLYARGLQEAAHLTVLEPGQTMSAWVELVVNKL